MGKGLVWLKRKESDSRLPVLTANGLHEIGSLGDGIDAPFPLVVDNFTEIEHSPTNHFIFAFDAEGIKDVEPAVDVLSDHLHVVYAGPQRRAPWWTMAQMIGIRAGTRCVIDFTVKFEPIYWTYDIFWEDPKSGRRLPQHIREFAFITPRDHAHTDVFLLFFTTVKLFAPSSPVRLLARKLFLNKVRYEFLLDKRICENVARMNPNVDLKGLQLGKFDSVLRSARKLIESAYYRQADTSVEWARPESVR
jgi:vanillate O-demethylase monooxygenase subunit